MTEILTAEQMRALEQAAIESGEVTGLELMERAGHGVVEAVLEEWPEMAKTPQKAVVLCGPGNNGGDGFVVARLLHERGWEVEVFLYGDAKKLPPDARVNYERWGEMGEVKPFEAAAEFDRPIDVILDALFGTGLVRPISAEVASVLSKSMLTMSRFVSVDIVSGLCSDSGKVLGGKEFEVSASLTVTFHRRKMTHQLSDGPLRCGRVVVKDIGLDGRAEQLRERVNLVVASEASLLKRSRAHKYTHGHALILSGPSGHTGAARLAARGALRIGAGLVTLGVPAEAQQEVASQITSIMMRQIGEGRALEEVLKDERLNVLCLGPGMGIERAREMVPVALGCGLETHPTRGVVLDADALTAYADAPKELFGMLHPRCVLTPHGGEFARLFPDIAEKLNAPATEGPAYSKVDATREAAKRAGCVVLFKGADTVIAAPDGRCSINSAAYEREAPWLATAGSGDVLAGFIAGLLARGFEPLQAAETAAWLHVECALKFGPGLIAEDLPEQLPAVFRDLEV